MKTKLVLWGKDDQEEKVLMAIQLRAEDNQVDVWTFHGEQATSDLHKQLLYEWREGKEMAFPSSGYNHHESELSATGKLLPDNVFAEKEELIDRAKTEWYFVVLSSKLNEVYQVELAELREKIEGAENYSADRWDELKVFWDKVRGQMQDNNLARDHANTLKRQVNALFSRLKELRSSQEEEFQSNSLGITDKFNRSLKEVNVRIGKGEMLHLVFEELKTIQRDFRTAKLTREDRAKLWEKIDGAFKAVKERRFGPSPTGNTPVDRHQHRLTGLIEAIGKMERSIKRDYQEQDDQERKKGSTSIGQLESQLLDAKINIIKGRVKSKETKLKDMHKTREEVEAKLKQAKQRMEEKVAKAAEAKKAAEKAAAEPAKQAPVVEKDAPASDGKVEEVAAKKAKKVEEKVAATGAKVEEVAKEKTAEVVGKAAKEAKKVEEKVAATETKVEEVAKEKTAEVVEKAAKKVEKVEEKVAATEAKVDKVVEEKAAEAKTTLKGMATEKIVAAAAVAPALAAVVKEKVAVEENVELSIAEEVAFPEISDATDEEE